MSIKNYKLKIKSACASYGLTCLTVFFSACGDWLDVIPDGVPTLDMAFNSRAQTYKYLATCYSHMPNHASPGSTPFIAGGDEITQRFDAGQYMMSNNPYLFATGMQNATSPMFGVWASMYQALRDCNIFLDNVAQTPDLPQWERSKWIAEVKFLKAYYHFCLVQMYGPVPLIRENIPVHMDVSTVKVEREPVDECFQYIVELLDEAIGEEWLPLEILDPEELGRITKAIALAFKAKVLVTAASPLFNGNNQQATLRNHNGTQLFNTTYSREKWEKAMIACREAIEACHNAGHELYYYNNTGLVKLTDTIAIDMTLRGAFTERWNSDIIWANTQSVTATTAFGIQGLCQPKLSMDYLAATGMRRYLGAPLKIASMFYTDHGVPLEEDIYRNTDELFKFRTAQTHEALYVLKGRTTIDLHFDREPRFYAWLGFDGAIWFGAGRENDKVPESLWYIGFKLGEPDGTDGYGPVTGYLPKKVVYYTNRLTAANIASYSCTSYPWPLIRLSDLYLMYAEAINEFEEGTKGPNSDEMFHYIDLVRARAGLQGVKYSWDTYTANPKYNIQTGMRQIIQRERMIELCFEGHRFWDLRRWMTAPNEYRNPIEGWNMNVAIYDGTESEVNQLMYTRQLLYQQKFSTRDYFWPIRESDITANPNLVQNIGW